MDNLTASGNLPMADLNRALHCLSEAAGFTHLLRAAEGGCLRAQMLAGLAYQTGRGVDIDYQRAGTWYRMAAAGGDSYAIANLGLMSLLGQGAPADDLDAYAWIQSAVGLGHQRLRPALDLLDRRIAGEPGKMEALIACLVPETPVVQSCTRSVCDPCRCSAA